MNVNQMFPSRYVTALDLNGSDVTACIKIVVMEGMKNRNNKTESKPVVIFERATKGMVLNKTNAMTIASLYGPETDNWVGKSVTLYATEVEAFGKQTKAIRIRPKAPPSKPTGKSIEDIVTDAPPDDGPDLDWDESGPDVGDGENHFT